MSYYGGISPVSSPVSPETTHTQITKMDLENCICTYVCTHMYMYIYACIYAYMYIQQ